MHSRRIQTFLVTIILINVFIFSLFKLKLIGEFSKNDNDNRFTLFRSPIHLTNISNIYLDVNKSATFYSGDQILVMTFLVKTMTTRLFKFDVKLLVRVDDREIFYKKVNILEKQKSYSNNYIFSILKLNMTIKKVSKQLTYQLETNGIFSPEYPINFVNTTRNPERTATARLIKCMWMPSDSNNFETIVRLILDAQYDDVYICLFARDRELKSFLKNRIIENDSIWARRRKRQQTRLVLVELENVPHFLFNKRDIVHYNQIAYDRTIEDDKESLLDPVLEFLLNQIYPFLVENYLYVHAGDYDQLLFSSNRNGNFYHRVNELVRKSRSGQIAPHASLYLNQYWALSNRMSGGIYESIEEFLAQRSIDVNNPGERLRVPIVIKPKKLDFYLTIGTLDEWKRGVKILEYLRKKTNHFSENLDGFRYVVFKFTHQHIYGQTVHNTKSSLIIKLCGAGEFFRNGLQQTVQDAHFVHYRDSYDFGHVKQARNYLDSTAFVYWDDFVAEEI